MTGERLSVVGYDPGQDFEDGAPLADGGPGGGGGVSGRALRVAADGQGDLLALGEFNNAVFRFDSSGRFVNRFGSQGDEPGLRRAPMSICVGGQGRGYGGD